MKENKNPKSVVKQVCDKHSLIVMLCSECFVECSESKKKYSILKFNASNNVDFTKCGMVCISAVVCVIFSYYCLYLSEKLVSLLL